MPDMTTEYEVKFALAGFSRLREALAGLGAECGGRWYEQNVALDDRERSLTKKGWLLRLRQGEAGKLTFKTPVGQDLKRDGFKAMREVETRVADLCALAEVFAALGYEPALRYEKVRETWRLDEVKICLDLLPFGRYAELEGPPEAVSALAPKLGLPMEAALAETYHDLNRRARESLGLAPERDFVFDRDMRARALTNEGLALLMQCDGDDLQDEKVPLR
jgi:adenylate cyclase, class 2